MKFLETALPGVVVVEPDVYRDARGFFVESYQREKYEAGGIAVPFVQDNLSSSARGVLRGLHLQTRRPQAKLVRVALGEALDVVVDVDPRSATFKRHVAVRLDAESQRQIFVPAGYAHGIAILGERTLVEYKVSDFYDPGGELSIRWNDPELAIPWPLESPVLSAKDAAGLPLAEALAKLGK